MYLFIKTKEFNLIIDKKKKKKLTYFTKQKETTELTKVGEKTFKNNIN